MSLSNEEIDGTRGIDDQDMNICPRIPRAIIGVLYDMDLHIVSTHLWGTNRFRKELHG